MKKPITLFILLLALSIGQMWADEITVYTTGEIFSGTGDDAWDNDASTIGVDLRYGYPECYDCEGFDGYYNAPMTKTAYTYNGYPIYSYTLNKAAAQFRFKHFKNSVWKENYTADWHSTTGQIYRGYWDDTHHWVTYGRDITIYAVPESMDGSKWTEGNTLKAVFKYGDQESEKTDKITWTKTDYTYEGNYIYKCTFLVPYNVIKKINFYYNDGEDKDLYEIAWNDATQYGTNDIDGKIFLGWKNESHTWVTYGRDITIYTVPETLFSDGEKYTTPFSTSTHTLKCNFKYGSSDGEWVSPMPEMTKTAWKYNSATLYKVRMLAKYNVVKQMAFQYFNGGSYINEYLYSNNNADFTDVTAADVDGKIYTGYAESAHHWESYATDITLDKQSGSGGTNSITATVGSAMPAITLPTRVGYVFGGYYSEADGGGTQYYNFDGSSVNNWVKDGPTTLYAKWSSMLLLYPLEGGFVDFPLTSLSDNTKALHIGKAYFANARPGNRIKIDGPDDFVKGDAKFFFGDCDVNHVPGSDFRQVPTGSDVLPVYIYLTKEMIDYIKTHDLCIYGQNMTINRVELEVGRADEYGSQPQKVIWMGDFTAGDLSTIDMCINQLDVDYWTDYQNMIIYHNAGTKDYSFNVRTNWDDESGSGIISFWKDKNHITQEKNFTVVDLVHSNASTVIGATPDRLFIQRDDHAEGDRTPFTITSIVLEKSDTATAGSTWSGATWSQGHPPTTDECAVITAPMTVDVDHAIAGRVVIDQYGHTGQLTIQPNKGLDVRLTVKKTTDGSTLETTSPADLVLESSSDGNASLIFENDENQATVQMYSKAYIDGETWNWQFMGIPFTSTNALYSYYGSYLYEWQSDGTWDVVPKGGTMTPFTGYCITQSSATTYTMSGTLNSNSDVNISIPENKEFVMANSWTAPISVCNFTATTLPLSNQTIYLYNTGFTPDPEHPAEAGTGPGTYVAMPINSAVYTGNYLIAPMEGFYVDNRSGSAATITLKYDELVRPSGSHTDIVAGPMHAPKRAVAAENEPAVMKIKATGSRYSERIVILERGDFSAGFDNGWDGKNLNEPGVAPILYALREDGTKDAVSAIPTYEGTVVGFRQGEDNAYTFSFDYDGEDVWYLNDLQELQSTLISEENRYAFTSSASDSEARFIISATPIHKTPTGMETVTGDGLSVTGVRKILINNHLYIIKNGRLYGADGRLVK